jgi:hypothetical protein
MGWFYYLTIGSVLLVLALSANTAFADFPRLTRAIALDDYMPRVFLIRGRRLLYSWGIYVLVALTALLLIFFGGVTDRLIPLFAIGAFMAFTLSQAGMVMHWKRQGKAHGRMHSSTHVGAVATGITTLVVLVAKFAEGAWITALLVLAMILLMHAVKRHYVRVKPRDRSRPALHSRRSERAHRGGARSIAGAASARRRSRSRSRCPATFTASTCRPATIPIPSAMTWEKDIVAPLKAAGRCIPKLVTLKSPYRYVLYTDRGLRAESGARARELQGVRADAGTGGAAHWWEGLLHNRRSGPAEGASADARQPAHCGD